ncbi:MAG: FHA domain-containing protein [Terrimicrobiaceae bacterium]
MAFLIQVNEGVKSVILPLGRAVILIGRDVKSNLYLDASGISKDHASIIFSNETYILKDNGSSSGTIINGTRVSEHKLAHDDVIQFGPYYFKVDLKNPTPVTTSATENDVQFERAGHSYTRRVELEEIAGRESNGPLHVVMTNTPKTLPQPLPATGFLANLSLEQRQNLSLRGVYRYARTGEVLIHEGHNSDRLLLLITGKWEARKLETQTILGQINAGEWVGEVSIFDPSGAMCSVVAVEPSEYWEITRDAFEKFINDSRSTGSAILIALAATLGRRIRQSAGALEKAVNAPPVVLPPKRSRFTPVFAVVAILAIIAAAVFFFTGTADKNRLQAENQQLAHESEETQQEATQSISSLRDNLKKAKSALDQAMEENDILKNRLAEATETIEQLQLSQTAPAAPDTISAAPAETPAVDSEILAKAEKLSGFPSKIIITKKTNVSLIVDGKVTGSVVLPEGHELPVVDADKDSVIVEFGDARQVILKANTNFAEALVAEAEAAQNKTAATPQPTPSEPKLQIAPVKPAPSKLNSELMRKGEELTFEKVTSVLEDVKLLHTIDELRPMRGAASGDVARYLRSLETKWKRAARESAALLPLGGGREEYRAILRKIIEASEMLDPARAQMFESKLREIDSSWLKLKTEEKIQSLTDSPSAGN